MFDRWRRPQQRPWPCLRGGGTLAAHCTSALAWALAALGMALLYVVWLVMIVGALLQMHRDLTSQDWPSVPGTTLRAALVPGAEGPDRHVMRYAYVVQGTRYTGSSEDFPDTQDRMTLEKPGAAVRVYYDPAHPADSRVVLGLRWLSFVWLGVGAVGTLFAGVIAWDACTSAWTKRAAAQHGRVGHG